jgi:hypothetical protein
MRISGTPEIRGERVASRSEVGRGDEWFVGAEVKGAVSFLRTAPLPAGIRQPPSPAEGEREKSI